MALTLRLVFLILAILCFAIGAIGVGHPRINVMALGLFFLALSFVAV